LIAIRIHFLNVSEQCRHHIRDLRRIRNTIDHITAGTVATSLIHSKLDYCNSLLLNLPSTQTNRLQLVLHMPLLVLSPKLRSVIHISPILKSPLAQHL
jgi:hypothetical protein